MAVPDEVKVVVAAGETLQLVDCSVVVIHDVTVVKPFCKGCQRYDDE
jgi:hypothetical protein